MRILLGWILPVNSDQKKMTNLINIKNRLVIHYLRTIYYEQNYIHPVGSIFAAIQKNESLLKFPSVISMLNVNLLFNPLNLPGMGSGVLEEIMSISDSSLRKRLGYEVLSFSLQAHSLSQECIDKLAIFSLTICLNMSQYASPRWNI